MSTDNTIQNRIDEIHNCCLSETSGISVPEFLKNFAEELQKLQESIDISEDDYIEVSAMIEWVNRYSNLRKFFMLDDYQVEEKEEFEKNNSKNPFKSLKEKLKCLLECQFKDLYLDVDIRLKSWKSLYEKIWRDGKCPSKSLITIKDTIGARIIIYNNSKNENIEDCYKVADAIKENLEADGIHQKDAGYLKGVENAISNEELKEQFPWLAKSKDYIANPKENGYQGIHLVFEYFENLIEFQIKTLTMFDHSENSLQANHNSYKKIVCKKNQNVDYTKIQIFGFYSSDGMNFVDRIGLVKPLTI